jgi:hypothetical protein
MRGAVDDAWRGMLPIFLFTTTTEGPAIANSD